MPRTLVAPISRTNERLLHLRNAAIASAPERSVGANSRVDAPCQWLDLAVMIALGVIAGAACVWRITDAVLH